MKILSGGLKCGACRAGGVSIHCAYPRRQTEQKEFSETIKPKSIYGVKTPLGPQGDNASLPRSEDRAVTGGGGGILEAFLTTEGWSVGGGKSLT